MAKEMRYDTALACKPNATARPQGAERVRYWKEHIERWHRSGMTQKDYCQQNELKWSSFHYWRKRQQERPSPLNFVQVSLGPGRHGVCDWPGLVLVIADRYKVQVGDEFHPATLARLVETLGRL